MLLIVGGIGQGQLEAAFDLTSLNKENVVYCENCSEQELMSAPIICDYHLMVKRMLSEGGDIYGFTERLMESNKDACILMDEIGCGVVPVDGFDREYRETAGRIGCILASKAGSVYRVFCGIPTKIK